MLSVDTWRSEIRLISVISCSWLKRLHFFFTSIWTCIPTSKSVATTEKSSKKRGREKKNPLWLHFCCHVSYLSGSEANLFLHQSSDDSLWVGLFLLWRTAVSVSACMCTAETPVFNQSVKHTPSLSAFVLRTKGSVDVLFGVLPVSVLVRSLLPETRARRGWPGSRRC